MSEVPRCGLIPVPQSGALELGLPVELSAQNESPPAPPPVVDEFDRDPIPQSQPRARDSGTARRTGENPFTEIVRRALPKPPRRLVACARGLEQRVEVPPGLLARLVDVAVRQSVPDRLPELLEGVMLVFADARDADQVRQPMDTKAARVLAGKLLETKQAFVSEDVRNALRVQARNLATQRIDIHAYVQRVLRECYMIQCHTLWDYALKVRHLNDLKKSLRDRGYLVRCLKTSLASSGADTLKEPLDWLTLDETTGWFQETWTEAEVAAWQPPLGDDGDDSVAVFAEDLVEAYERFHGESGLQPGDLQLLGSLLGEDGGDNQIRARMEELVLLLPEMNVDDLRQYLVPILAELTGGNTDEEQILTIFRDLPAYHCLYLFAHGGNAAAFGFGEGDTEEFNQIILDAAEEVASALGYPLSSYKAGYFPTPDEAAAMLEVVAVAVQQWAAGDDAAKEDADNLRPKAGDPKYIETKDELENYLKDIEDQLNSIGEDSQLANCDLQNVLQRQQQTLQMMSNISKMLHDTALAIVRKYAT